MSESPTAYVEETTISQMFFKSYGRLNRLRYFKRKLVLGVLLYVLIFLGYKVLGYQFGQDNSQAAIYNTFVSLIFVVPNFFLNVRRLQDMNKGKLLAVIYAIITSVMAFLDFTGINYMLYFSLFLATAVFFIGGYMLISPGTNGNNRFGESPI